MKNFNIFGVHGKIQVLDGGFMKNQYIGRDCLKRGGLDSLHISVGGVFEGGWYPNAHYDGVNSN